MLKVVISGYGRMGHNVEEILKARGVECAGKSDDIASFDKCLARECVCIDFSTPDAFRRNYRHIASNFRAAVIGTTGWDDIRDEVIGCFERQGTPMVYSSNFSVGVNVLSAAVALIAKRLGQAGGYCRTLSRSTMSTSWTLRAVRRSPWRQSSGRVLDRIRE